MDDSHRPHRLNSAVFLLGTAGLVVGVGLIAALITWAFHPTPVPPCTANCPPPRAPSALAANPQLPEQNSYASATFGFHIDYPDTWKVESTSGDAVLFDTTGGLFQVKGTKGAAVPMQLIQTVADKFEGSDLPDFSLVGPLHGAHIGTQEGVGEVYGGTYVPPSGGGESQPVRVGIIVATRGGLTLVATAFAAYDQKHDLMDAFDIDYALSEFRWPGE